MQLEISREALLRPLQLVSGALGGRPTLPILGNVVAFGLNRFFFAWLAAYPALLYFSSELGRGR